MAWNEVDQKCEQFCFHSATTCLSYKALPLRQSTNLLHCSAIVLLFGWFVIVSAPARQSWEAAAGHGAEVAGKGGT